MATSSSSALRRLLKEGLGREHVCVLSRSLGHQGPLQPRPNTLVTFAVFGVGQPVVATNTCLTSLFPLP